jgi:hypothetical protein
MGRPQPPESTVVRTDARRRKGIALADDPIGECRPDLLTPKILGKLDVASVDQKDGAWTVQK